MCSYIVYSNTTVNNGIGNGLFGGAGSIIYSSIAVTNSYYNKDIARAAEQYSAGRTAAQMQSGTPSSTIYTNWDTDVWNFGTATEYPILR